MTNIVLKNHNDVYFIQATGHATGSSEACNGISAILYALSGWLNNYDGKVRYSKIHLNKGESVIEFSGGKVARALYDLTAIGLLQIAEKYPDSVKAKKI